MTWQIIPIGIFAYLMALLPLYLAMLSLSKQRNIFRDEAKEYREKYIELAVQLAAIKNYSSSLIEHIQKQRITSPEEELLEQAYQEEKMARENLEYQ